MQLGPTQALARQQDLGETSPIIGAPFVPLVSLHLPEPTITTRQSRNLAKEPEKNSYKPEASVVSEVTCAACCRERLMTHVPYTFCLGAFPVEERSQSAVVTGVPVSKHLARKIIKHVMPEGSHALCVTGHMSLLLEPWFRCPYNIDSHRLHTHITSLRMHTSVALNTKGI